MILSLWRRRLARHAMASLVFSLAAFADASAGEGARRPLRLPDPDPSTELSALAAEKRKLAIERLVPLIQSSEGEPKAEMMLRLAELYIQQGRTLYLSEMASCEQAPASAEVPCDNRGSRAWQERSVALYEAVLRGYPRFERADHATFFLGAALSDLGRKEEAADAYRRLVKLYPESGFVPDALLMLGEYYFDIDNDAFRALAAYARAAAAPSYPKHSYALYRLAWCQYNVGELDAAIESLQRVVREESEKETSEGNTFPLADQAVDDLVQFYADANRLSDARQYLEQIGRTDLIPRVMLRLANILEDQGKRPEAIAALRELQLQRKDHRDNPTIGMQIARNLDQMGDRDAVIAELDKTSALVSQGSSWAIAHPEEVSKTRSEIGTLQLTLAKRWHETARQHDRSGSRDTMALYQQTGALYEAHLSSFPDSPDRSEALYLHGELLYRVGDYPRAYERYTMVVSLDPKGPRAQFCAEAAIHAAEEQIRAEGGTLVPPDVTPDRDTAPKALTEWEQNYVDACASYIKLFPGGRVQDALYRSAYLLYARFRFDDASVLFRQVVANDPRTQEARLAADLILDALAIRQDWDALAETAKAFAAQSALGDRLFRDDIQKIYVNAEFKRIEARLATDNDKLSAARSFEAFAEQFPDSATASLALNNAATYYSHSDTLADAMRARERLILRGEGPYLREQLALLGYDKEQTADFLGAAELYERRWSLPPRDERALEALYSASLLRMAHGDLHRASLDAQSFATELPDDRRTVLLLLGLVRAEQESNDTSAVVARCTAFDAQPPATATARERYWIRLQLGDALAASGQPKRALAIYRDSLTRWRAEGSPDDALQEIATARLRALAPSIESYRALAIHSTASGSPSTEDAALKRALAAKLEALIEVETELKEIIAMGAGQAGLQAMLEVGALYEELALALSDSDRPRRLTPEQLDDYERELVNRIYTQELKAYEAYHYVFTKSIALGLLGEQTKQARARLNTLRPEELFVSGELLPLRYQMSSTTPTREPFERSL